MKGAWRADAAEAVRVLFWDTHCAVVGVVALVMRLRRELMSAIHVGTKHVKKMKSHKPICGLVNQSSALSHSTLKFDVFSYNQFGSWVRPAMKCFT